MWILTEGYDLVDLTKYSRIWIDDPGKSSDESSVVFAERGPGDNVVVLRFTELDTASELVDAIVKALEMKAEVFSVTAWLDHKIDSQLSS